MPIPILGPCQDEMKAFGERLQKERSKIEQESEKEPSENKQEKQVRFESPVYNTPPKNQPKAIPARLTKPGYTSKPLTLHGVVHDLEIANSHGKILWPGETSVGGLDFDTMV